MIQKTLFDTPAKLSRRTDPITSQKSAAETEPHVNTCEGRMLAVLRKAKSPLTAREAGERRCDVSGKAVTTYTAKERT